MTASINARAARSVKNNARAARSVKNEVSRHAVNAHRHCPLSPSARASSMCSSAQEAQPLPRDTRTSTSRHNPLPHGVLELAQFLGATPGSDPREAAESTPSPPEAPPSAPPPRSAHPGGGPR
nr:hypothetical protein [Saccharopolyspora rectivirgula]